MNMTVDELTQGPPCLFDKCSWVSYTLIKNLAGNESDDSSNVSLKLAIAIL